jgi:hypothetical protein
MGKTPTIPRSTSAMPSMMQNVPTIFPGFPANDFLADNRIPYSVNPRIPI